MEEDRKKRMARDAENGDLIKVQSRLLRPVDTIEEKWKLLPAFLKVHQERKQQNNRFGGSWIH